MCRETSKMNIDLNVGWSIEDIMSSDLRQWIRIPLDGSFDPEQMAEKCRDPDAPCPLDCSLPVICPFGHSSCSEATAGEWQDLMEWEGPASPSLQKLFSAFQPETA